MYFTMLIDLPRFALVCVILILTSATLTSVRAQVKALPDSNATWTTVSTDSPPNGRWYGSQHILVILL